MQHHSRQRWRGEPDTGQLLLGVPQRWLPLERLPPPSASSSISPLPTPIDHFGRLDLRVEESAERQDSGEGSEPYTPPDSYQPPERPPPLRTKQRQQQCEPLLLLSPLQPHSSMAAAESDSDRADAPGVRRQLEWAPGSSSGIIHSAGGASSRSSSQTPLQPAPWSAAGRLEREQPRWPEGAARLTPSASGPPQLRLQQHTPPTQAQRQEALLSAAGSAPPLLRPLGSLPHDYERRQQRFSADMEHERRRRLRSLVLSAVEPTQLVPNGPSDDWQSLTASAAQAREAHDARSCTTEGCCFCAYLARLARTAPNGNAQEAPPLPPPASGCDQPVQLE